MRKIVIAGILMVVLSSFGMEFPELDGETAERVGELSLAVRESSRAPSRSGSRRGSLAIDNIPVTIPSVEGVASPDKGSKSSEIYVPENIDVTCCLESGGKLCYVMYSLCKFGVGACELASSICGGFCVIELKETPSLAWGLGLAGVITNIAGMGLTYALFNITSKVRKLDKAIGQARTHQNEGA
jgi:hypothetical protein